jgi:hypothetical protein
LSRNYVGASRRALQNILEICRIVHLFSVKRFKLCQLLGGGDGLTQLFKRGAADSDESVSDDSSPPDRRAEPPVATVANSDLELVLRSQKLECILASFFPSGTKLEDLGKMGHAQFSDIVNLSHPAMVQLLVDLAAQVAAVGKAQDGAGGSKFTLDELKGGPLDDFYKGVTGVCGEPDADIEKGMREERLESL